MAHNFNFPHAVTSSTSSKFPKIQENGYYRSETMKSRTAEVLDILYAEEVTFEDAEDSEPESFSAKRINSLSVLIPGHVSCIRGSERSRLRPREERLVSFDDVFGDKTEQMKKRLSFENEDVDNETFFLSDEGKKMLLKDHDCYKKEFMFKNDVTCSPCSSWKVFSRKSLPDISSLQDTNHDRRRRRFSIGEFIKRYSEPLGSFPDHTSYQKVNFGCVSSTPARERQFSFSTSFSPVNETLSNSYIEDESTAYLGTEPLSPMLLYSVTPRAKTTDYIDDFNFHIGTTNFKNVQRLKAEEKMKAANCVDKLPFTSFNNSIDLADTTFGFLPCSSNSFGFDRTTTLHSTETRLENFQGKDSVMEQWIVQPQELTLDVSSKGCRLELINNSAKDLKFKTKFDLKITNVCPLSGILPAKGKIGLRVLVSRFLRERFNENTEDTVKITCGKTEKDIYVKICKEKKSKNISHKERTYICF